MRWGQIYQIHPFSEIFTKKVQVYLKSNGIRKVDHFFLGMSPHLEKHAMQATEVIKGEKQKFIQFRTNLPNTGYQYNL